MKAYDTAAIAKAQLIKLPGNIKKFFRNSLAGYLIESRSLKDSTIYAKYWALIWATIFKLIFKLLLKRGPIVLIRELVRYPWIFQFLGTTGALRRLTRGRKGAYLEATGLTLLSIAQTLVEALEAVFYQPERLLINEDLVPPEIAMAMGLNVWLVEGIELLLPVINPTCVQKYIDETENAGVNPDACSFVKSALGMIIKGQMPKGVAIVSSNMPCDAGMASYSYIQRKYGVPIYRIDTPFHFYDERAEKHFVEDLKGMIAFLEKHTPGRMDWDRLREICKARNRMMELEGELWEMMRAKPAPLAAEAIYLSHIWHFAWFPGNPIGIRLFEKLVKLARKNLDTKTPAVEKEKYRAVLWNPWFPNFENIFNIAERKYGITVLMDSMTYNRHSLIDTTSPETMLRSLSQIIMQGPMVRHTRGPAENYLDDIFRCYKQFDLDMVWVANHVSCKSAGGLNGILREKCRDMKIPLLVIDYDLLDTRIVSQESMMNQLDHFMENVMKARRIDNQQVER